MIGIANAQAKAEKLQLQESAHEASLGVTVPENASESADEGGYDEKSLPPAEVSSVAGSLKVATVTYAWCLHAYLLTREGAKQLISRMPVSAPADIFVASFLTGTDSGRPVLAGRAVLPAIAKASPGNGDVKSLVALRAGGATVDMVRGFTGLGKASGKKGSSGGKGGGSSKSAVESGSVKAESPDEGN